MKRVKIFALALVCMTTLVPFTLFAQAHGGERGTATATVGGGKVTIEYGRPELKGRDLLAQLAPGKLWRMGKDAATTLTSDVDLDFGGKKVAKGKYTLVAKRVDADNWNLLVLSKGDAFRFDPAGVVAEVPMQVSKNSQPVEVETIELVGKDNTGTMTLTWGTLKASANFKKV